MRRAHNRCRQKKTCTKMLHSESVRMQVEEPENMTQLAYIILNIAYCCTGTLRCGRGFRPSLSGLRKGGLCFGRRLSRNCGGRSLYQQARASRHSSSTHTNKQNVSRITHLVNHICLVNHVSQIWDRRQITEAAAAAAAAAAVAAAAAATAAATAVILPLRGK